MTKLSDLIESSRRRDEAARTYYPSPAAEAIGRYDIRDALTGQLVAECLTKEIRDSICASRTTEPLFREIAAVAVEAIEKSVARSDDYGDSHCSAPIREALSKIQSLIDEAEKTK